MSAPAVSENLCVKFERLYREAYGTIDTGINLITQGNNEQATAFFQKGLKLMGEALAIDIDAIAQDEQEAMQYKEMQSKMLVTRKEVTMNFTNASDTQSTNQRSDSTTYADCRKALQECDNSGLTAVINQITSNEATPSVPPQDCHLLFHIETGVQLFFIYENGRVTTPCYPTFLAIFQMKDGAIGDAGSVSGFLQVGQWHYPLLQGRSPVLHSFYGAYMFPDPVNEIPGTSVGILIPDFISKDNRDLFEQILQQMTSYHSQETPAGVQVQEEQQQVQERALQVHQKQQMSTSQRIAQGAETLSEGLVWGAGKLGELMSYGSEKLCEGKGYDTPTGVDPKWRTGAKVAKNVSGTAVKVSGFVLNQVGRATMALGRHMAPSIQKQGTKAVGRITGGGEEQANKQVEGVMEVATGLVKGASTLYVSLEGAAATLASSLKDNTVKVVSHKYGSDMGLVTDDALAALGQTAQAGHNIAALGVKGIAKRTAKDTGKALIDKYDKTDKMPHLENDGNVDVEMKECGKNIDNTGNM